MRVRVLFLLVRRGTAMTEVIERRGWGDRRAPRGVERPLCRHRAVAQPGAARRRHAAPPRRVPPSADTIRRTCVTSGHVVQSLVVWSHVRHGRVHLWRWAVSE